MKPQILTIEKKRYRLLREHEYEALVNDLADLKKVIRRRKEPGIEATTFFKKLKEKKK